MDFLYSIVMGNQLRSMLAVSYTHLDVYKRQSVKGFVPYLVKLPVPLVPLEKIPVPALHLPKLHKELFRHFQLVGFALPVLKADKIRCV